MKNLQFALRLRCQSISNVQLLVLFIRCVYTNAIYYHLIINEALVKTVCAYQKQKFNNSIYIDTVRFTALTR